LKDILLRQEYTFQLEECACGEGTLDLRRYIRLATAENPHMPMIIEHLTTDEAYISSIHYVHGLI
jgi:sugar phosphate isomerase/epimerase